MTAFGGKVAFATLQFLVLLQGCQASRETIAMHHGSHMEHVHKTESVATLRQRLVQGIRQQASAFLANDVSAQDLEAVKRTALVSALEEHGLSLEKQFQLFLLRQEAHAGLFDHVAKHGVVEEGDEAGSQRTIKPHHEVIDVTPSNRRKSFDANEMMVDLQAFEGLRKDARQARNGDECQEPGCSDDANAATDEGNDEISGKEKGNKKGWFSSAAAKMGYLSQRDPEAYHRQKKNAVSMRERGWMAKLYDKIREQKGDPAQLKKMRDLFDRVNGIYGALSTVKDELEFYRSKSWAETTEFKKEKFVKRLRKRAKAFVVGSVNGMKKFIKNSWQLFAAKTREEESKCIQRHKEQEQKDMKSKKMKSGKEMSTLINEEGCDGGACEQKLTRLLEDEQEKASEIIDEREKATRGSEEKIKEDVKEVEKATEDLTNDLACNGNSTCEAANQDKLKKVEEALEEGARTACDRKEWWIVKQLKKLFGGIITVVKSAHKASMPTIGIRGIGGSAGFVGGGFEEVIDFWNKEIGVFTWGSAWAGMNSLTAGLSGYAGVGWKGYKLDWNLEEAYQTAMYAAYGASTNFLPLGAGLSATVALDADNSAGSPWIPDPTGCNGLVVGMGVGVGMSLPMGVDFGQAKYRMFTSECFYDKPLWQFIGMIWLPYCLHCSGVLETAVMTGLRTVMHAASFPVITDVIHSMLAVRVHHMKQNATVPNCRNKADDGWETCPTGVYSEKKPDYERCSIRSTSRRDDVANILEATGSRLEDASIIAGDLIKSWDAIAERLEEADAGDDDNEGNKELWKSKEFNDMWNSLKHNGVACFKGPIGHRVKLADDRSFAWIDPRFERKTLESNGLNENIETCMELENCGKTNMQLMTMKKKDLVNHILQKYNEASEGNLFGTCTSSSTCRSATHSSWHNKNKSKPVDCDMGWCTCAKNFCHAEGTDGAPAFCKHEDEFKPTGIEDFKGNARERFADWIRYREIELGSALKRVNALVDEVEKGAADAGDGK